MEPLIKAKNLNFVYNKGKDNEFKALINISLDIYPREFVIVFGPSGCGKSTLLNVIAGLEPPDSGSIFVSGKDIAHMSRKEFSQYHRKGVGMIYQSYNLVTSLNVLDNIALPQMFLDISKGKREQKSHELLKRFGIDEQAKKVPTELSGGQQQRIGIARAIINNPDIVLADEPVGNLDSISAKNVLEILKELNEKEKKTIAVVTHNPEFLDYGDRIIHMKDGMITREVVNRQKYKKRGDRDLAKPPTSELENLMRAYQGLTPEQINILIMPYKAKLFAHHFITTRNLEETKVFEDVMQRRLLNTIGQDEFFNTLRRSQEKGGAGFDRRSAGRITRRINRAIRMAYYIYRKSRQRKDEAGVHMKIALEEKAEKLTEYLLKTCYRKYYPKLSDIALLRIKQAVRDRLAATINKSDFFRILDLPFKEGGAGLNSKTARAITEEIELVFILGYGVSQTMKMPKAFDAPGGKPKTGPSQTKPDIPAQASPAAPQGRELDRSGAKGESDDSKIAKPEAGPDGEVELGIKPEVGLESQSAVESQTAMTGSNKK